MLAVTDVPLTAGERPRELAYHTGVVRMQQESAAERMTQAKEAGAAAASEAQQRLLDEQAKVLTVYYTACTYYYEVYMCYESYQLHCIHPHLGRAASHATHRRVQIVRWHA
jgi:hypothetical protein